MRIGEFLFRYRSFIPVPYIIFLLVISKLCAPCIILGVVLIITGEILRIYTQRFTGDWTRGSKIEVERVVDSGPFSIVRHPLYIANLLIGAGYTVLSGNLLVYLIPLYIVLFGVYYTLIILAEEDYLTRKFPDVYPEYRNRVSAFIPLRFKWNGGDPSPWREGIKREKSTILTIMIILLSFTGRFLWMH